MRRVVITGQGSINPLGSSIAATNQALRQGICAIRPLDIPDIDRLSVKIGAQVRDYHPEDHFSRQELALLDRLPNSR